MTIANTFRCIVRLLRDRTIEHFAFDSKGVGAAVAWTGLGIARCLSLVGQRYTAVQLAAALHRAHYSAGANRAIEKLFFGRRDHVGGSTALTADVFDEHVRAVAPDLARRAHADPWTVLGKRFLIVKSWRPGERGVIILDYMYAFPLFARLFDVAAVMRYYHIVLEPSWVGACNLDILTYARYDTPVFVETTEPEDASFLQRLGSNLIPVTVSGNWWVDHRLMHPIGNGSKDVDVVMLSGWMRYKRHAYVFAALAELKRRGHPLKLLLVGYAQGGELTRNDLEMLARYYRVEDLIEWQEDLDPEQVNVQLNRAKVHVLWSRKEGYNRAVIEAMLAGVPSILRKGHNFGYEYPYINQQTGCFATESDLPIKLLWMTDNYERFSPREWVLANMSCERATATLSQAIRDVAVARGEQWTRDLAVKNVFVGRMRYWHDSDQEGFKHDYERLLAMRSAH